MTSSSPSEHRSESAIAKRPEAPRWGSLLLTGALLLAVSTPAAADSRPPRPSAVRAAQKHRQTLRAIYEELVEIDTTQSKGSTTRASEAMAARLRAAGFPAADVQVLVHPGNAARGNLVARLRGTGSKKPILLVAHLDVVEARRQDWSEGLDPFQLTERGGYFYGRGTTDDKAMAAIFVANLIRYRQEGFRPERDIILALTADEEGGDFNGVSWLVENHRALIEAEVALNEGGGGAFRAGKRLFHGVEASQKVYQSFSLEVKNKGGHSSLPVKDNAIYRLAAALDRLSRHEFPVMLNEVTRTFFRRSAAGESGQTAADMLAILANPPDPRAAARLAASSPVYNALMRTTCVATQLEGGHAENALPQKARAVINCRVLPDHRVDDVESTLARIVADPAVAISRVAPPKPSPPSPLTPSVMKPIESLTQLMWPGVPVIPIMSTGATDALYLRRAGIPTYGVSGIFGDIDDTRAHGKDERLLAASLWEGQEFLYRLVRSLSDRGGK
jgi:acetylornithine deacetylase/succinyl-diaminopimelate desuccinylase-like protein